MAWLAAAGMTFCGCAINNTGPRGVGQAAPLTFGQRIGAAFQRTGEALTPKPRVVKAKDPLGLKNQPDRINPEVYTQAAQLCEQQGNIDGAIEQYQQALAVDPKHQKSLVSLAQLYAQQSNYEQATISYRRALEVDPRDAKALLGLARLYARQEDYTNATTTYRQAIQAHPENGVLLNDLGLCYARQGDVPRALQALSQAVQVDPKSQLYRNNFGTLLADAGQTSEALQQFSMAHGPSAANYNLGVLLYQKGDHAAAARHLQQAVQLDPSMEAAHTLLARLDGGRSTGASQVGVNQANGDTYNTAHYDYANQPANNYGDGGARRNMNDGTPSYAEVQIPEVDRNWSYGEAQTPPQPVQYGSDYQTSAFPRPLPPVQ
ncbi:MAG: tetratricopeptide repeat protein [Pirellulaceae bacterium]